MNQFFKPPQRISRKVKMLISGKSGTGKTWYALTAPRPLAILDLEGGSALYHSDFNAFESFDRLQTQSIKEIEDAVKSLEGDSHYKSLVIDPITIYYELLQDVYHEKRKLKSKNDDATITQNDWREIKRKYRNLMIRFINLNKNVIIIAREKDLTQEVNGQHVIVGSKEDCEKNTDYTPDITIRLSLFGNIRKILIKKDRSRHFASGDTVDLPPFETWLENKNDNDGQIEHFDDVDESTKNNIKCLHDSVAETKIESSLPEEWSKWILRINGFKSSSEASNWWLKHRDDVKEKCSEESSKEIYQMILDKSSQLKTNKKEV